MDAQALIRYTVRGKNKRLYCNNINKQDRWIPWHAEIIDPSNVLQIILQNVQQEKNSKYTYKTSL